MDRLAEIKAREQAATPGLWVTSQPRMTFQEFLKALEWAREDIPWLIAEVERLRDELAKK